MKKVKNNKKELLIIGIIVILLITSVTMITVTVTKKDLDKNMENKNIKEPIKENVNNHDNDTELDKTINTEKEENNTDTEEEKKDKNSSTNKEEKENSKDKTNNNATTSKPNNSASTKPNNIAEKPTTNNNGSTNKPNNDNTENSSNQENNTSKPEIEEKPETKPETPPVEEDKNNIKRKTMENTYGIKILYGDEVANYNPKGITPTRLTNSSDIENYLNRLNTELAKYPKGFFNDFNKKGMPLTIYLIKSANGAFSGFTDYQFMNNIKLTLTTSYDFEYTVHHELMHYIDCYLDIVMYPKNPYSEYESLNPNGFIYGNATSSQIYNMGSNPRGAYFISSYGATHVKEDRAEVFKYMTARAYKPIGCFEPNEIIRKKAEIISKQIKTYFPSITGTAHWDRFIN